MTVLVVGLAAGRASYDHQRAFAELAGEDRNAWSLPLSVDGMMIVASLTLLVRRWQGRSAGLLAWTALLLGGRASLAANVAVAEPTMAGRLAAVWPPVCLLVSFELLLEQIHEAKPHPDWDAPGGRPLMSDQSSSGGRSASTHVRSGTTSL